MTFIAYKITHRESGKAYIGVTTRTLKARWDSHYYKGAGRIGMAVRKYGRDAFDVEQIAAAISLGDLLALERMLIVQHGTMVPSGYNLCAGGEGVWEPSEETRAKMSAAAVARTGRVVSEETKTKIAASLKGHSFSPETLEKMRQAKLGGMASAETKAKLSAQRRGRKLPKRTPEQCARLSAACKGKKMPPRSAEHNAKISALRLGIKRPEVGPALSAAWARRRAAGLKNKPRQQVQPSGQEAFL